MQATRQDRSHPYARQSAALTPEQDDVTPQVLLQVQVQIISPTGGQVNAPGGVLTATVKVLTATADLQRATLRYTSAGGAQVYHECEPAGLTTYQGPPHEKEYTLQFTNVPLNGTPMLIVAVATAGRDFGLDARGPFTCV